MVEQAIRTFSRRNGYNIHLDSSITHLPTKMLFFGMEDSKKISLIRIKNQLELILPKLIVSFQKDDGFRNYRIHTGFFLTLAYTIMSLVFLAHTGIVIAGQESLEDYIGVFILMLLFVTAGYLEIFFVERRIKKAIAKIIANEIPD